jgi:AraC family transcriptional regulator
LARPFVDSKGFSGADRAQLSLWHLAVGKTQISTRHRSAAFATPAALKNRGKAGKYREGYELPVFDFVTGSTVEVYDLGPVEIHNAPVSLGIERQQLSDHSICFHHDDVRTEDVVDGKASKNLWQKGSVGFVPASTELRSTPEHPYQVSAVRFRKEILARACEGEIDLKAVDFRFADITGPTVYPIAQSLLGIATTGGFEKWPMLVENAALTLMVAVIRKLSPSSTMAFREVPCALDNTRRRRVFEYIEANLHRRLSLSELADVAALSQWHFLRQFQRATGMTPIKYLGTRRVHRAKIMLRSTSKPLAEISLDCGFSSQSAFTTYFGAETGVTPREYRYSCIL